MKIIKDNYSFAVTHNGKVLIKHSEENPFLYVGIGKEKIKQHLGDFNIEDRIIEVYSL